MYTQAMDVGPKEERQAVRSTAEALLDTRFEARIVDGARRVGEGLAAEEETARLNHLQLFAVEEVDVPSPVAPVIGTRAEHHDRGAMVLLHARAVVVVRPADL